MADIFRVTSYEFQDDSGAFSGSTYTLVLEQDLVADYFLLIQSGGPGTTSNGGPDDSCVNVVGDPTGRGDLAASGANNELDLQRTSSVGNWVGTIHVIECLLPNEDSGFKLRACRSNLAISALALNTTFTIGAHADDVVWGTLGQVTVLAGANGGGGARCAATSAQAHQQGCGAPLASGTTTVRVEFDYTGSNGTSTVDMTIYVVEWGSDWRVEQLNHDVAGNGGDQMDSTGEYTTISIPTSSVTRANSFVLGGWKVNDNGKGDGPWGVAICLGDGVTQNATETVVAHGAYYAQDREVTIYVLEHSDCRVDHQFGTDDSTPGIPTSGLTGAQTIDGANGSESYDNSATDIQHALGYRFTPWWGGVFGTGNQHPQGHLSGRVTGDTTAQWERGRSGQPGAYWMQVVDLALLTTVSDIDLTPDPATATASAPATVLEMTYAQDAPAVSADAPASGLEMRLLPDAAPLSVKPGVGQLLPVLLNLTLHPAASSLAAAAPALTLQLDLTMLPDAAVANAVAPASAMNRTLTQAANVMRVRPRLSPDLPVTLLFTLTPAASSLSAAAPALTLAFRLEPDAAVVNAGAPAVALNFGLVLTPSPSTLTAAAPAVLLDLILHPAPSSLAAAAPAVLLDLILHPDAAVLQAQAPAVAVNFGLVLQPDASVASAVAPAILLPLILHPIAAGVRMRPRGGTQLPVDLLFTLLPGPSSASAVAPALTLEFLLLPAAAVVNAGAPAVSVDIVTDLTLLPGPATVTALAPAVTLDGLGIKLLVGTAVVSCRAPSPLLDLPGIEVVRFDLLICRTPRRDLVIARALEYDLAIQREVRETVER